MRPSLLAQAEPIDDGDVAIVLRALQVVEQPTSLADELQKTPSRMVVLRVLLEMSRQVRDAGAQQRDLYLGRARVGLVRLVRSDGG